MGFDVISRCLCVILVQSAGVAFVGFDVISRCLYVILLQSAGVSFVGFDTTSRCLFVGFDIISDLCIILCNQQVSLCGF